MKRKTKQEAGRKRAAESWQPQLERKPALDQRLLEHIKARLPEFQKLLEEVSSHWHAEDRFYRFYHQTAVCDYVHLNRVRAGLPARARPPSRVWARRQGGAPVCNRLSAFEVVVRKPVTNRRSD